MNLAHLAHFESPDYPVLSLYINRESLRESVRVRVADLLKPLRASSDLDHDARMSLRTDLQSVAGLVERIDSDKAPATAVFACHGGGLLEYLPLSAAVWDVAVLSDRPYLRPVRSIRRGETAVAVVVDRRHAWIYCRDESGLHLLEQIEEPGDFKDNYGGFSGYEERGSRSHAEDLERRHFRFVADRMFEHHRSLAFDRVVVGGHEETTTGFGSHLHQYLRDRLIGMFVIDPHTMSETDVKKHVDVLLLSAATQSEESLAATVIDTAGDGGKAVLGLVPVLEAVNAGAVDHLVVAGRFTKDGVVCTTCGRLSRNGDRCLACGSAVNQIGDLVDVAIEQVLQTGGSVDQISVSSLLDQHGVGALIRYAIVA